MQGYYYGKPMDIHEIEVWMYDQDHKAEEFATLR